MCSYTVITRTGLLFLIRETLATGYEHMKECGESQSVLQKQQYEFEE